MFTINALRKGRAVGARGVIIALAICIIYAMSDEFHQLFISGRAGRIMDVLIDSSGAFTGIIFISIYKGEVR